MKGIFNIGNESIKFQDGQTFASLVVAINKIRSEPFKFKPVLFNEDKDNNLASFENFVSIIFKEFGIKITRINHGNFGVFLPSISNHHTFKSQLLHDLVQISNINETHDIQKAMGGLGKKIIEGKISLKESKVSGVFSNIGITLQLDYYELFNENNVFKDEEIAAIILHEMGHVFTTFELVDRSVTTNQALAYTNAVLSNPKCTEEDKLVVFSKSIKLIGATEDYIDTLVKSKDIVGITTIYLDMSSEVCISQLGASVYDSTGCEYLADDFATRHQSGKYLVDALVKYHEKYGTDNLLVGELVAAVVLGILFGSVGGFTMAIAGVFSFFLFGGLATTKYAVYDTPFSRFNRIKHVIVSEIKTCTENNQLDDLKNLLSQIESIEKHLKDDEGFFGLLNSIAYLFKPSFRRAHKYELLQKKLEEISSNDLFIQAAKLKTME